MIVGYNRFPVELEAHKQIVVDYNWIPKVGNNLVVMLFLLEVVRNQIVMVGYNLAVDQVVYNQVVEVGYNFDFALAVMKVECNQIEVEVDCNQAEEEAEHIQAVQVHSNQAESLVEIVYMREDGNLAVTVVECILFVVVDNRPGDVHNHSLKMVDLNSRERLNHNLS